MYFLYGYVTVICIINSAVFSFRGSNISNFKGLSKDCPEMRKQLSHMFKTSISKCTPPSDMKNTKLCGLQLLVLAPDWLIESLVVILLQTPAAVTSVSHCARLLFDMKLNSFHCSRATSQYDRFLFNILWFVHCRMHKTKWSFHVYVKTLYLIYM